MRLKGLAAAGAIAGLLAAPVTAAAVTLEPIGAATYDAPTYVASDPANPDRLFVTEQDGTIDVTTPTGTSLYLDLTDEVLDGGERGLWSIAFPPDFGASRLFYVAYSANDGALTLDEYREEGTPVATEATRRQVLAITNNFATSNHNGGQLQFGPDGYLYWSTGEDANSSNAQSVANLLGKILRLDPRGAAPGQFTVPPDNPFVGGPGEDLIWALGLRNPWRFSFDRLAGGMLIADVGASSFEEVSIGVTGGNYGWPTCEGPCGNPSFVEPIYAYSHAFNPGSGDAIAGGYVVRDPDLGDLYGRYLFADTYSAIVSSIDPAAPPPLNGQRIEDLSADFPVSFGEDACGRLYIVTQGDGRVYRLEGASAGACPAATPPDTDPPETSLKLKRKNKRGTRYVARIGSDEPNSTFECRLDRRKWKPCGPKRKLKRLDPGRHRFRARATDAAWNTDPDPAKKRFRTKTR